jgi:cysteine desulfurase/selenocysteine lyase
MIYLDYAATSWPKPPEVLKAMSDYLEYSGGNPGRSGHRLSIAAGRAVFSARQAIADLFNAPDPLRVVFTPNVTYALNLVIEGLLRPGDRVVTSSMEHNSVMRPLRALEQKGIQLQIVQCGPDGGLDLESFKAAILPGTRLVVTTHASNVTGTLFPITEIAELAHEKSALFLVDAAQTAGVLPIDLTASSIDFLAFTGHKGLYGPPGTGGLVIGGQVKIEELEPLVRGGTGSRSEFEQQPEFLPDKYESGTVNGVGFVGLGAGARWVMERGIEQIRAHEAMLTDRLISGLLDLPELTLFGPNDSARMTAVLSCRIKSKQVSYVGLCLDDEFEILSRVGLHCSPSAHRTIGTFSDGTIRLAPGFGTSFEDIDVVIAAIKKVARDYE